MYPTDTFYELFSDIIVDDSCPRSVNRAANIYIPVMLRKYAGITRKVSIVGVGEGIEIWDTESWKQYEEKELSRVE